MHNFNDQIIRKPNFIIIGAAKCGTTALASILSTHPDCCMSQPKEVSFFQDTIDFQPNPNYEKGWEWYQQAFSHYSGEPVVGEATPSYSDRSRSPNTANRIYDFNSDMKIIYMVRHPFQRQISAWKMHYVGGLGQINADRREHRWALDGFEHWMKKQREADQWDMCRYGYQISAYEKKFSSENIFISFLENWSESKDKETKKVLDFLHLDPNLLPKDVPLQTNRASDRTLERPLFRKIRSQQGLRTVFRWVPATLRNWIPVKQLSRIKVTTPEPEISDNLRKEFYDYIKMDIQDFCQRFGNGIINEDTYLSY